MKYDQLGRSMVEMLGVLAIVGVLSVVAVMGIRYAMDKNRPTMFCMTPVYWQRWHK